MPDNPNIADRPQASSASNARALNPSLIARTLTAAISQDIPTVTLGTAGAAPTISGGIPYHLRRLGAVYDTSGDPQIEIVGCPQGEGLVDATDTLRGDFLTNGASQARRWTPSPRIMYGGTQLEAGYRALGTTMSFMVYVDGLPVANAPFDFSTTAAARYWLNLTFPTARPREIRIEPQGDAGFRGFIVEPTRNVQRVKTRRPTISFFGDSLLGGANGITGFNTAAGIAARYLGFDNVNLSIGGSGVFGTAAMQTRIPTDVAGVQPDVLVYWANQNDRAGNTPAAIATQTEIDLLNIERVSPLSELFLIGSSNQSGDATDPNGETLDALLRDVARRMNVNFISVRDPYDQLATVPPFNQAEANIVGDVRSINGFVWRCIVAKAANVAFSRTNWRSTALMNGTGRVGTPTGDGNRDILIGATDNIHGLQEWHNLFGAFFAQRIYDALKAS